MARDPKAEAALALHRFGLGPRVGTMQFHGGGAGYRYPIGYDSYLMYVAMWAQRFLHETGQDELDLAAVAIEQRNPVISSRSTVGTATEVYDYLRLLWARIGRCYCRKCGAPVHRDTPEDSADRVSSEPPDDIEQCVLIGAKIFLVTDCADDLRKIFGVDANAFGRSVETPDDTPEVVRPFDAGPANGPEPP